MAVDISKNVFELFSGGKRTRLLPTLAIAIVVTGLVAVPMIYRAIDARNNLVEAEAVLAPADTQLVLVDTADAAPAPLDAATVSGSILISLREDAATAVSFNLFASGSDEALLASQDLEGPQFDLIVSDSGGGTPLDSSLLSNGEYELFLTIKTRDEDRRTAVRFQVQNP